MSSIDDNTIISLDESQKQLLLSNLNEEGKITCLRAFKVAKLIGKEPKEMSAITKNLGLRITNCELGVFGKLQFQELNEKIYNRLQENYKGHKELECKDLWEEAKKDSLRQVGSTVKNSDYKVVNCQLGCFRRRENHK